MGACADGNDGRWLAPAAHAAHRAASRSAARGASRSRHQSAGASHCGGTRMKKFALTLGALVALVGCSSGTQILSGKPIDYKTAGSLPPLEIPPDLSTPAKDDRFSVPGSGRTSTTLSA